MFKKRVLFASLISTVLFAVAAIASPIDTSSFHVTVPVTISDVLEESSAMTHADFIEVVPYVVDLAVATPVPIANELIDLSIRESVEATDAKFANRAVKQNLNFERML